MAGLHLRYPTSKLVKDMIDELLKRFCTAQKRIDSIKVSKVSKEKKSEQGQAQLGQKREQGHAQLEGRSAGSAGPSIIKRRCQAS